VLPDLVEIVKDRGRLEACTQEMGRLEHEIAKEDHRRKNSQERVEKAVAERDNFLKQQVCWQRQREVAQATLTDLAPHIASLGQRDKLRSTVAVLDSKIAAFPDDMDKQIATLNAAVEHADMLAVVIPLYEAFRKAQEQWRHATYQEATAKALRTEWAATLGAVGEQARILDGQKSLVDVLVKEREADATVTHTLAKEARARLHRFQEVAQAPTCSYCGQQLQPDHVEAERAYLDEERCAAEERAHAAKAALKEATEERSRLAQLVQRLSAEQIDIGKRLSEADQEARDSQRDRGHAEEVARNLLVTLPEPYRAALTPPRSGDTEALISGDAPSDITMVELRAQAAERETLAASLAAIWKEAGERDRAAASRAATQNLLDPLEQEYSDGRTEALRTTQADAQESEVEAADQLSQLAEPLSRCLAALDVVQGEVAACELTIKDAKLGLATQQASAAEIRRTIIAAEARLPEQWLTVAATADMPALAAWNMEAASIADAGERLTKLHHAEQSQHDIELRQAQIVGELAAICPEARCSVSKLEAAAAHQQETVEELQPCREEALGRKQALEVRQARRCELEEELKAAGRQSFLYKELAGMLGRDNLQYYLLQQAEAAIVAAANHVLDHISNATLRLELRHGAAGDGKALDLVVHNNATGGDTLPVSLLSGSQRFRVAVSLALGIGQYASQGSHSVQSVIIDEGFGSLDPDGRHEMIAELHALKDTLQRIIVVSHQEEFSSSFKNGYEIKLVNGASRVQLVGS